MMPAEAIFFKQMLDYAIRLMQFGLQRSSKKREQQIAFAKEFREALIMTRAYLADVREGTIERDREREVALSRAWNSVGHCGRELEPQGDFYAVFFQKADYWSDPRGWVKVNTSETDISLRNAEREANKVIEGDGS